MKWHHLMSAVSLAMLSPAVAHAQPTDHPIAPATTTEYPAGISVVKTRDGPVYVDSQGRTLYGMDMRTVVRWSPDPSKFCKEACTAVWEPMLAPAGSTANVAIPRGFNRPAPPVPGQPVIFNPQNAPDWTIIESPSGLQWVYKGWHVVYARKGDKRGSTEFDGAEGRIWNTLKFIPPVPALVAPLNVSTVFIDDVYVLADDHGRALFTGKCRKDCSGWVPMAVGLANRGVGQWAVNRSGNTPQWNYRGKPVFVSQEEDPVQVPKSGVVLRP